MSARQQPDSSMTFLIHNVMKAMKMAMIAAAVSLDASAQTLATPQHVPAPVIDALQVSAIDHVGMNVPDIDAAVQFFSDLIGARVIADARPEGIPAEWKTQFRWHQSSELKRFIMLQLTGGPKVELFQYAGHEINSTQPHEDDIGATHVALRTKDIARSLAIVKARGLKVLNEPITNADGVQWFYFLTPWGSQIELVSFSDQYTATSPHQATGASTMNTSLSSSASVDLSAVQRLIDQHFEIWNAPVSAETIPKFAQIYTADVFVADEGGKAVGYEEVAKLIRKVQSSHAGFVFTPDPVTWNHGLGRVTWGYGPRSHPDAVRGEDIFTIEDGKVSSARVFLDKR
ncbi:VOC family protein [Cupriavidus sp. DL-D2]|uniref:VOC family protein n=1 Tax=Cupriavidus sp. DL-D2 TaxID=3144974 RepID=UPI003212994D